MLALVLVLAFGSPKVGKTDPQLNDCAKTPDTKKREYDGESDPTESEEANMAFLKAR